MKALFSIVLVGFLLCGCAQQTPQQRETEKVIRIAKEKIAKREQWAYDGDYKVTDYMVHGEQKGWTVTVMRINDPNLPVGTKGRYFGNTPVIITLDLKGHVIAYSSPFRHQ